MATGIPLPPECFAPVAYSGAGTNRVGILTLDSAGYPSGVTTGDPTHTVGGAGFTEAPWPVWLGMDFCRIDHRIIAAVVPIALTGQMGQLQVWQFDADGNATTSQVLETEDVFNCTLVPLPDGYVDLFYQKRYTNNLLLRRSGDGGETWGAAVTYTPTGASPTATSIYALNPGQLHNTDLRGGLSTWDPATAPAVAYNPKGGKLFWNFGSRHFTGTRTTAAWDFQEATVTSPAFATFVSTSMVPLSDGSFVGGHVAYDQVNSAGQWRTRDFISSGFTGRESVFNPHRMVTFGTQVSSANSVPGATAAGVAAMPLPFIQGGGVRHGVYKHTGSADWHVNGSWTALTITGNTVRADTGAATNLPAMLWTGWPAAWFTNRNSVNYPDAPTVQAWTSFYPGRARWKEDGTLELLRPNATDGTLQFLRCRSFGGDDVMRWEGDF